MTATRSSISFNQNNWKQIANSKNRSALVNKALEYYFKAQAFLKSKEEEFILSELEHYQKTGEHYTFDETFKD